MNLLDVVLLLFMAAAAFTGYRIGLAARAMSWLGVAAGLAVSVPLVPLALGALPQGTVAMTRLFVGLGVVLLCTSVLSAVGDVIGLRLRHHVHKSPFGPLDRGAGFVVGALSILLVVWFLLPALASTPGPIARAVRQSAVISWVDGVAPEPPQMAQGLARLIDRSGFPQVFADLGPSPVTGPPPSQIPVPPEVVEAATASTVNVEAFGCGRGFEGSGFVVAPGVVVTNAHVVAGADDIQLRSPGGGTVTATIRHSDPNRDLALLEAPDLAPAPLPVRASEVGEEGAAIGYPGGQDQPRVAPAAVAEDRPTVGRDIYGRGLAERRVLYLSAQLRQGDSGSALIGGDGAVIGVVFAVSPDNPSTAYALHVEELQAVLAEPPNESTGACL